MKEILFAAVGLWLVGRLLKASGNHPRTTLSGRFRRTGRPAANPVSVASDTAQTSEAVVAGEPDDTIASVSVAAGLAGSTLSTGNYSGGLSGVTGGRLPARVMTRVGV
jgi:hypothetical protein